MYMSTSSFSLLAALFPNSWVLGFLNINFTFG
jgi:hypothetical protein